MSLKASRMNKLTALIGDKTGKKTQYRIVEEATTGGHTERVPFSSTDHTSSYSSSEENNWNFNQNTSESLRQRLLKFLLILCACLVPIGFFRHRKTGTQDDETIVSSSYRPCQLHSSVETIRLIQTTLTTPSEHWSNIACIPLQIIHGGSTVQYTMPSATVDIDFNKISHPDREPILGFGGAFTEASALNFMSLNSAGRAAVLQLLFGKDGLGYSLGRVHMNSCDFSIKSYNFDNVDGDFDLDHFDSSVTHDVATGMVRMILEADAIARTEWNSDLGMRILVSPWSPPPWMKQSLESETSAHSETMTGSAYPTCIRDGVGPKSDYAKAWAKYFGKFITAYKKLGVNIFSITVQNEPEFAAPWEACAYDPPSQASFIEHHLGPMLQDEHPDVKLLIFDHNKDHVITWGGFIVNGTNAAAKYVDGTAYHWYAGGMDRLLDGAVGQSNMHRYMKLLKDMNVKSDHLVLGSEGCHCPSTGYAGGDINVAWSRAERYAHTILADLAAGSNGFIEWNLILDAIGGPNHLGNLCDSPLLAVPYRAGGKHNVTIAPSFEPSDQVFSPVGDTRTREELNALGIPARYLDLGVVVQPMFFYMGHISRYVRPGSRAVDAIFDPSSVFRHVEKDGIVVAGGGVNNLARPGIDVTLWPCEGSTRQKWEFDSDGRLRVYGHDWLGQPMISCIGKESDPFLSGLLLNECNDDAGVFQIVQSSNINETHDQPRILFSLQNGRSQNTCLVVLPVANRGGSYGPKGGGQVTIGDCSESSALWNYNVHGEVRSSYGDHNLGDVCLTTGWPFLQIGAFLSPSGEKIAIILNEAADAANYELLVDGEVKLTNAIPPHAIQTLVVLEHI